MKKLYCITNFLFFDILFYSYSLANLSSSIICLFADYMYISLSNFFCFIIIKFHSFCFNWDSSCNFFCSFITNQITCCFCSFSDCSFWSSFKCICSRLFSIINKFLPIITKFLFTFLAIFLPIFLAKEKYP